MSLLTPDSGLLFWMIVSFGIVFAILSKYGFPVIIKAVEQRKAYIDNSLETARQANEQLANIQAEGARILAEAKEKQNAILPKRNKSSTKLTGKLPPKPVCRWKRLLGVSAKRRRKQSVKSVPRLPTFRSP